ncbi:MULTISPECIES: restriction endonuclease subunit S [unclassified Nostoc]|uniref:restriction endonuclease subunit S n=1 Tax=unclassified Nostoc TaxID=2593658 RepID=UPI002AD2DC78|nr:restriction endonuclease subunit S [Nostoc sp. DedQUE03]MDZ7977247.1 restriction endonuclease subunit S [Nostoc sp. DedQUE03]MDZ8047632.1 restriction endonuclease subunit S [Nostoc sp. DedQUE02]
MVLTGAEMAECQKPMRVYTLLPHQKFAFTFRCCDVCDGLLYETLRERLRTAQPKLNAEICKKIKIKVPSLEEQEKIANFLAAIDRKIEALSRQIDQTEQFKKGLLQKMFV